MFPSAGGCLRENVFEVDFLLVWTGIILAVAAIPIMYLLARRKLAVAQQLGSRALRADAIESITFGSPV
jgi:divalent metal cation (Fe/Co/Zn/Cd) transporter